MKSKKAVYILGSKGSLSCSFGETRKQHCRLSVSSFIAVAVPGGVGE